MTRKSNGLFYSLNLIKKFGVSYFLFSLVLSVFEMIIPIVNIYGLKVILDSIENQAGMNDILFFVLFLFMLMSIVYFFSAWYKKYYSPIQIKKIRKRMRSYFYEISAGIDLRYFDDTAYYDKYIKALSEAENCLFNIIDAFSGLVGAISSLITVIAIAISMDGLTILFSIFFLMFNMLASVFAQKISYKEDQEDVIYQRTNAYVDRMFFLYQFAKEVRCFSLKVPLLNMMHTASENSVNITKKYTKQQTLISLLSNMSHVMFVLGVMTYLANSAVNGNISVGEFAALLTASQSFNLQVENVFSVIPQIHEHMLYINYLREFENHNSYIENSVNGKEFLTESSIEIAFENVSFKYPDTDRYILKDFNASVKTGQIIVVVGENGVGKSTIVKLLLRLYDVTEGTIKYNKIPIQEYSIKSLRNSIGLVLQDFQHYAMSVRDNLCIQNNSVTDEEIYLALQQVGMLKKIKSLPKGLDTNISKELDSEGIEFSAGEYQKLALARAFITKCPFVLFDEPTSSLDPNAEEYFYENLKLLCSGRTAIIVSHRLSVSKFADKIWVLEKGKIIEQGSHSDLMKLSGKYAHMYNNQAKNYLKDEYYDAGERPVRCADEYHSGQAEPPVC